MGFRAVLGGLVVLVVRVELVVLVVLVGCGSEVQPLLTEMPEYEGGITVTVSDGAEEKTVRGRLRFDRSDRSLSFVRIGAAVRMTKTGDGPLRVFEGGVSRAVAPDDLVQFQVLWTALYSEPDEGASVTRQLGRYEVSQEPFRLLVQLEPAKSGS